MSHKKFSTMFWNGIFDALFLAPDNDSHKLPPPNAQIDYFVYSIAHTILEYIRTLPNTIERIFARSFYELTRSY